MTKFVVGSGQSGAMGGLGMEGGDKTINSHVFAWTAGGWVVADPSKPPFNSKGDDFNNTYWNACKDLQADTGEDVYLVLSGKGGTPISEWGDGMPQWQALDDAVTNAMATPEMVGKTEADYFYWYHGSADAENEAYAEDFLALRDRAIASGWLSDDTITVAGETRGNGESKEALLNLIASGNAEWLHFAYNDGLDYKGLHPTGESCVRYGRAFFDASQTESNDLDGKFAYDHFDFGSRGRDILYATDNSLVLGAGGDDFVYVSGVGSYVFGGKGDDVFRVEGASDTTIIGGAGNDRVHIYVAGDEEVGDLTLVNIEKVRVHYGEPVLF